MSPEVSFPTNIDQEQILSYRSAMSAELSAMAVSQTIERPLGMRERFASYVDSAVESGRNVLESTKAYASRNKIASLVMSAVVPFGVGSELAKAQEEPRPTAAALKSISYPPINGSKMTAASLQMQKKCLPDNLNINLQRGAAVRKKNKHAIANMPKYEAGDRVKISWAYRKGKTICGILVATDAYGGYVAQPTHKTKKGGYIIDRTPVADESGNQFGSVQLFFKKSK